MAHPPVPPVVVPLWRQWLARVFGDRRTRVLRRLKTPSAPIVAPAELWALPEHERPAPAMDWADRRSVPLEVPAHPRMAVPAALVAEVRLTLSQCTGVLVPLDVAQVFLQGDLGRRLVAQGSITPPLRQALQDALGRHLVNQPWPMPQETERLRGYQVGIRVAARAAGYELLETA
jgi:hypothetical protein